MWALNHIPSSRRSVSFRSNVLNESSDVQQTVRIEKMHVVSWKWKLEAVFFSVYLCHHKPSSLRIETLRYGYHFGHTFNGFQTHMSFGSRAVVREVLICSGITADTAHLKKTNKKLEGKTFHYMTWHHDHLFIIMQHYANAFHTGRHNLLQPWVKQWRRWMSDSMVSSFRLFPCTLWLWLFW